MIDQLSHLCQDGVVDLFCVASTRMPRVNGIPYLHPHMDILLFEHYMCQKLQRRHKFLAFEVRPLKMGEWMIGTLLPNYAAHEHRQYGGLRSKTRHASTAS